MPLCQLIPLVEDTSVRMTYSKSAFEMPDGKYVGRFLGVSMREATGVLDQRTGQPLPPR